MIAGYEEPRTLRLPSTILSASPPRAGRMPFIPAPTRKAPRTPALADGVRRVGGAQRVRPGVPAAELEAEREQQRRDQVGEVDAREVLGEVADRLQHAVDLPAEVDRAERHLVKLSRLAVAPSRWTVLAPTLLAAALAAAYLIWAPVEPGPRRGDLPRRPVRRPRLRDLEQRLVLGALRPLLQRPLSAARGAARAAPGRRAGGGRGGGAVRAPGAAAVRRPRADPVALVRRGDRRLAAHRPDPVPARGPVRARRPARRRLGPVGERRAARRRWRASRARSPGLFVALAGVAIALAGERVRGAALAIGGAAPDRRPQPRLPGRRRRAVRLLGLRRDPDPRRGGALAGPGRVPGAADRRRRSTRSWRSPCS